VEQLCEPPWTTTTSLWSHSFHPFTVTIIPFSLTRQNNDIVKEFVECNHVVPLHRIHDQDFSLEKSNIFSLAAAVTGEKLVAHIL
jgi:hypothetical protein